MRDLRVLLTFLDKAGPAEEVFGDAGGCVEAEFVQVENLEGYAEFGAEFCFGHYRWAGVVWLAGVAGEDEAAGTGRQLLRYGRGVPGWIVATDGVVAAAIEEEFERAGEVGEREDIGGDELSRHAGFAGALFGKFDGERGDVDAGDVETMLGEPDAVGARAAADVEGATGLDGVLCDRLLQLGRGAAGIPGEKAVAVAVVPVGVVGHVRGSSFAVRVVRRMFLLSVDTHSMELAGRL